jgi:hypothetical protein
MSIGEENDNEKKSGEAENVERIRLDRDLLRRKSWWDPITIWR